MVGVPATIRAARDHGLRAVYGHVVVRYSAKLNFCLLLFMLEGELGTLQLLGVPGRIEVDRMKDDRG